MTEITLSTETLNTLFNLNCYEIPQDVNLVLVGIRGALPVNVADTGFKDSQTLQLRQVDYKNLNCTILQWQIAENKMAAFAASTVPNIQNILGYKAVPKRNSNCLAPGFYKSYQKGKHRPAKTANWHDAFRQDGQTLTIRRTIDNTFYDNFDAINTSTGCDDNIHAAWTLSLDGTYSSAGCQVVMGIPLCDHTKSFQNDNLGPWKSFKANGYAVDQQYFPYALFTSAEINNLLLNSDGQISTRVKFGSSGKVVKEIQQVLIDKNFLAGSADGNFGKNTFYAVKKFQLDTFGSALTDCIVGPVTAQALGVALPTLAVPTGAAAL